VPYHVPVVYFDDVTNTNDPSSAYCWAHERPYSELAADLRNNTVAQYNYITPDMCDDMHSPCAPMNDPIRQGDTWLSHQVPLILRSRAYQNGGALFITWDEGEYGDGPIGMIVLSPYAKGHGYASRLHYTHSSLLRTLEEIFGVAPLLGDAANATDLRDLYTTFVRARSPATPAHAVCDPQLWKHVHSPARLKILAPCVSVTGTVMSFEKSPDGDDTILLALDPQYAGLVNYMTIGGRKAVERTLLTEAICEHPVGEGDLSGWNIAGLKIPKVSCRGFKPRVNIPKIGDYVILTGSYVLDRHPDVKENHHEIHPITSVVILAHDSGNLHPPTRGRGAIIGE
jgi:hypothetical protein